MNNLLDILKKYAFLIIIAVLLIGFVGYYVIDKNKDVITGKSADGKDVIATIDGKDIYADDLYTAKEDTVAAVLAQFIEKSVILQSVELTDKQKDKADEMADTLYENILGQASSESEADAYIANFLKTWGFEDLEEYCSFITKYEIFTDNLLKDNEKLITEFNTNEKPRVTSHIFIKMTDANNPTPAELEKIEKVKAALAKGDSFEEVAKTYSDDSSASNGGKLDEVVTKSNNAGYSEEFIKEALSLNKGQVTTDWIKVKNSSYSGWHKIKVVEDDPAAILKDDAVKEKLKTYRKEAIFTANKTLYSDALLKEAKKLGIKFSSKEQEKAVYDIMSKGFGG